MTNFFGVLEVKIKKGSRSDLGRPLQVLSRTSSNERLTDRMNYFNPVRLVFGSLVRKEIIKECVGKNVLIICSLTAYNRYNNDPELSALFSLASVTFEHGFECNPALTDMIEISNKDRIVR